MQTSNLMMPWFNDDDDKMMPYLLSRCSHSKKPKEGDLNWQPLKSAVKCPDHRAKPNPPNVNSQAQ